MQRGPQSLEGDREPLWLWLLTILLLLAEVRLHLRIFGYSDIECRGGAGEPAGPVGELEAGRWYRGQRNGCTLSYAG